MTKANSIQTDEKEAKNENADFEWAISQTGFGKFNMLLFLMAIPIVLSNIFEISSLSYVFPSAQCDLNLTPQKKGLVNAASYIGMTLSCLVWGALTDAFGRKKILMTSLLIESVLALFTVFYTNFALMLTAKLAGGFIIVGAVTAFKPYTTEFHGKKYRSKVPLMEGLLYAMAQIYIPLLAWSLLPLEINFTVFDIKFYSWNIFLFVTAAPCLIAGLIVILMPESPKFLMTQGDNKGAMKVFQQIYAINTGKPKETYPVKKLIEEQVEHEKYAFVKKWVPLFGEKHRGHIFLFICLQTTIMLSLVSLNLWLPHIYQVMNDYTFYNNGTEGTFCEMITFKHPSQEINSDTCTVNKNNSSVYINAIIVCSSVSCGYLVASSLINILGKKKLLLIVGALSCTASCFLYFAPNRVVALVLLCVYLISTGIAIDTTYACIIDLFPTSLRGSAVSFSMLASRIGATIGNLMMPILLEAGCAPPFFTLAGILAIWTFLVLLLPNTDMKSLE